MRVAVVGAAGRMGKNLIEAIGMLLALFLEFALVEFFTECHFAGS